MSLIEKTQNLIMKNLINLVLLFALTINSLFSQNTLSPETFDSIVAANTYKITFDGKNISGQGANWLIDEAKQANYFLVGERHGTSDIPAISGAIYSKLVTAGYHYAALEIGRYAALEAQEILKNGGFDAMKNYLETSDYFQAIAFLDWSEESRLATRIVMESPLKEKALWGLDQEFLFGCKMYLERLEKLASTDEQKTLLSKLSEQLKENKFLLGSDINEDLVTLLKTFNDNEYATGLLESLIMSNKIYGRFRGEITRNESNTIRENLMKQNLVDLVTYHEEVDGKTPKVFFKFGGFHAAPNLGNGMSTLGTFVEEWALSRNESAFNIYLDAVSGTTLASGQDNPQGGDGTVEVVSNFGRINPDEVDPSSKNVFADKLYNQNELFLVDLRPLRKRLYELEPYLNTRAVKLITGFDAYLGIPNVKPGTPFQKK